MNKIELLDALDRVRGALTLKALTDDERTTALTDLALVSDTISLSREFDADGDGRPDLLIPTLGADPLAELEKRFEARVSAGLKEHADLANQRIDLILARVAEIDHVVAERVRRDTDTDRPSEPAKARLSPLEPAAPPVSQSPTRARRDD